MNRSVLVRTVALVVGLALLVAAWMWRYEPVEVVNEGTTTIVWDRWLQRPCYHALQEPRVVFRCVSPGDSIASVN